MLLEFGWLSGDALPPAQWDLRERGWRLYSLGGIAKMAPPGVPVLVDWRRDSRPELPETPMRRRLCLVAGVENSDCRATIVAGGLGDALAGEVGLAELGARLMRIARMAASLPERIEAGGLTLDLFQRDARAGPRWAGLHPREFAVLWRLAEAGGAVIPKQELLADVWRLDHDPGTNRVAVHISRLRAKLAQMGYGWLVATDPAGGYRLNTATGVGNQPCPLWLERERDALDGIS
ncbi:MAG: response regulator transcription factor [Sphingomonadales bacterium]|nr:response regulator transcription factor [Sphingomonadales bacterium]MBD3772067.1 response regulator transcription factor [Paracoccaceae bacterium]